jgi:hypothetical protein
MLRSAFRIDSVQGGDHDIGTVAEAIAGCGVSGSVKRR